MTLRIIEVDDQILHDAQVRLREQSIRRTIEVALRALAATPTPRAPDTPRGTGPSTLRPR